MGESSGFTGNTNKSRFFDAMGFQNHFLSSKSKVISEDEVQKRSSGNPPILLFKDSSAIS
jgi:hypothetical protein